MKKNIHTGAELADWPNQVGATVNATPEQAQAAGWRDAGDPPEVQAGYVRQSATWTEAGGWQVVDIPQAQLDAEAAAVRQSQAVEEFKANATRYTLQNIYILLCDQVFGTDKRIARGTEELLGRAKELQAAGQKDAVINLAMLVIGLNTELVREAGVRWWDECHWTENPDIIATAEAQLKEMMT
jgi:hypothetical protein